MEVTPQPAATTCSLVPEQLGLGPHPQRATGPGGHPGASIVSELPGGFFCETRLRIVAFGGPDVARSPRVTPCRAGRLELLGPRPPVLGVLCLLPPGRHGSRPCHKRGPSPTPSQHVGQGRRSPSARPSLAGPALQGWGLRGQRCSSTDGGVFCELRPVPAYGSGTRGHRRGVVPPALKLASRFPELGVN